MSASSAFHHSFSHDAAGGSGISGGSASGGANTSAGSTFASVGSFARLAPSGRPSRSKQPPLRLTRRGRLVFFGVPLVLLAALLLALSGFLNAPAKASESVSELSLTPTATVTVQPGESLWAIAGAVAPDRDPRDVVADIVQLNNLDGARVRPGQALFVPVK
jgi:LysM repeat protein